MKPFEPTATGPDPVTSSLNTQLTFDTVSDAAAFDRLGDSWDDLVRAMRRPSPFLLHAWLREWWLAHSADSTLAVQVARRDGRLVGALPIVIRSRYGIRVGEFMGGHTSALGDLLLAPGESLATATGLAQRAQDTDQDLVDLFGLPGDSLLSTVLPAASLRLIKRVDAPVLDLSRGWAEVYADKTSAKTRNLHRRRRRQLSELGKLEVEVATRPEELDLAIGDAFTLHQRRWAGRPDGSEFASTRGQQFHRAAIHALAELDIPRIVLLKLDGRAIAFHYYFAFCGRMYVHRLAFDPDLSRYSPGLVNTLDAIEAASAEGLILVEYLGGAERYKEDLSDRRDPLYQGIGLIGSPLGKIAAATHMGAIELRKRLKRSPALRRFYFERLAPARRAIARLRGGRNQSNAPSDR